jgi:hypothetical protein
MLNKLHPNHNTNSKKNIYSHNSSQSLIYVPPSVQDSSSGNLERSKNNSHSNHSNPFLFVPAYHAEKNKPPYVYVPSNTSQSSTFSNISPSLHSSASSYQSNLTFPNSTFYPPVETNNFPYFSLLIVPLPPPFNSRRFFNYLSAFTPVISVLVPTTSRGINMKCSSFFFL